MLFWYFCGFLVLLFFVLFFFGIVFLGVVGIGFLVCLELGVLRLFQVGASIAMMLVLFFVDHVNGNYS